MRKGEKKLLVVFMVLFILYVATSFLAPEPIDWRVTFASNDKNPFGGFILQERSSDLFKEQFEVSRKTISELPSVENLFVSSEYAGITGADYNRLLSLVDSGANVLIAANQFSDTMQDSLNFEVSFSFHALNQSIFEAATSEILLDDSVRFEYPFSLVSNYFKVKKDVDWKVHATLGDKPILLSKDIGKGKLYLTSTPYIFTNFGLLYNQNHVAAEQILSLLPEVKTHHTLFYHLGKGEATTPLRYLLRNAPLKWSLYLGLFTILLFLIVSSRRLQRPIPLLTPPSNTTVKYVKTLGALFYREGSHKKAAERTVNYFLRDLRERYYLKIDYSEKFYGNLSNKADVDLPHVIETFELILKVRDVPYVDEKTLDGTPKNRTVILVQN